MRRKIELLSPAKDVTCGYAAINCGADAIYIGSPKFGARKGASNGLEEIEQLIKYAHTYNSKIYIALNTLLFDHELEEAEKLAHQLYNIGADALIIQDMGLLEMNLPPLPIHASTQTDNRDWRKVKFLEDVGFDQVVLARELTIPEIATIKEHTNVTLEYFIHGALCVSFSGQCYMSQAVNGRSANRGDCAQPCRLKYNLTDGTGLVVAKDKHLLSLKDNNQTVNLKQLMDAGISSFKIEGRLKDVDYVKNITAHYRKEIDQILVGSTDYVKASSGKSIISFAPNPQKSFSRGFTQYFANDRVKGIGNLHTPKSLGEELGRISKVARDHFTIDTKATLNNGDGLCFLTNEGTFEGFKINKVEGDKLYPQNMLPLKVGEVVYRNFDQKYSIELSKGGEKRVISIDVAFVDTPEGFKFTITDEDGIISVKEFVADKTIATNPNYDIKLIENQISKFGNTIFEVKRASVSFTQNWFMPNSTLNNFRREAAEEHELVRAKSYIRKEQVITPNNIPFSQATLSYRGNVINNMARKFYERHGVETMEWGVEKSLPNEGELEVMHTRHCILFEQDLCLKTNPRGVKQPVYISNAKDKYRLEFDCFKCEMKVYKEM